MFIRANARSSRGIEFAEQRRVLKDVVIPRESGVSSTPRPIDSITTASGILDRPPQCAIAHKADDDSGDLVCEHNSAFPRRDAPEVCMNLVPPKTEGAGKTGCALHPRSRAQIVHQETHTSIQVQRKHSGLPCAMVLRLISRSPR
jgi:hypothetical protein